ncbi:FKBP-type peptidyl-prolyl cis-trans isomerase, partial [Rothia mucilaginosa]|uniref:FKBP-type peptidyl-prolyl cis-trans isomerase n=1 Tax=Rothia mucilaginosa TaxID=43675 RepID=UPI0028EF7038
MTKRSKLTIFGASAAALALALSACGAQSSGDLSKVQYTLKNATAEPEASFATPFAASSPSAYVIEEGNGDSINDGDYVLVEAAVFNGTDGKLNGSTYSSEPILLPINDQLKQAAPQVYETLKKIKVGGSFSYTTNVLQQRSTAGVTTTTASPGAATNVEVYTVKTKLPKYATGKAVEADPSLPSFTLDESTGKAEIKLPDNKPEVTELTAKTLIEGEGAEVKETDTVYVRYIGVQYSDSKVVDGNYDAATPMGISLQGVIKGWTQGLKGKKVGS